jgi:putative phage-type endonuclease
MQQQTPEWFQARLGKATASRMADIMTRTKNGFSAKRRDYLIDLCVERLTGQTKNHYVNSAMQWGIDHEADARFQYEVTTGAIVEEAGFVEHPTIANTGASPDGIVYPDGIVEIKCPESTTHFETLLHRKVEDKYSWQIQWQLACTQRAWCDFISYDPRYKPAMRLCILRIARNDDLIKLMQLEVKVFLDEVDNLLDQLFRAQKGVEYDIVK